MLKWFKNYHRNTISVQTVSFSIYLCVDCRPCKLSLYRL